MSTRVGQVLLAVVLVMLLVGAQVITGSPAEAVVSSPTWGTAQKLTLDDEPMSLSCPVDGFCAATDSSSVSVLQAGRWQAPVLLGPTGHLSAVSCASAQFCVAVVGNRFATYDGSRWHTGQAIDNDTSDYHDFVKVSCPTTGLCVAGGADGSSAVFDGSRWTSLPKLKVQPDLGYELGFLSVSCVGENFCMAQVDGDDDVDMYRLQGGRWSPSYRDDHSLDIGTGPLSCATPTFCVGAGGLEGKALRWDGTSWTNTSIDTVDDPAPVMPSGMSCVSATFCVAVGEPLADEVPGYAFQFDGRSWSARSALSPVRTPDLVSCASVSFCMSTTLNGMAVPVRAAGQTGGVTTPTDLPPRFDKFPKATVYPGDSFTVRAVDPEGGPVALSWSLPTSPVSVTCKRVASNEARCKAERTTSGNYAPSAANFAAQDEHLTARAAARISMRRYVGLGDSYSSGEGSAVAYYEEGTHFPDPSTGGDTGCHRSRTAWGSLMGEQLLATRAVQSTAFVACSGAKFTDLYNANSGYASFGEYEPRQLAAVNRDTFVATMTMGGNDVGFETILTDCSVQVKNIGGTGCREKGRVARESADRGLKGLRDGMEIPGTGKRMTAADVYENVAERMADGGTLVVGGYPHLFNTQGRHYLLDYCGVTEAGPAANIYIKDAKWINKTVDDGNEVIKLGVNEAQKRVKRLGFKTHITYADPVGKFGKKTVCSGIKKSLINYAILRLSPLPKPVRQSFHPKKAGQYAYYKSFCDHVPVGKGVSKKKRCQQKEPV